MPDDQPTPPAHGFATRLSHGGRRGSKARGFVNMPVHRGSTMLYPDCDSRMLAGHDRFAQAENYGIHGSATHHALENMIAEIEGGTRCQIVSSGLAAVTTPLLAVLRSGDHLLMPDSVYGPARTFADGTLRRFGIETTYYDPTVSGDGLRPLMRPNTTVLWLESPGSHTFEMQDVPALAAVAHEHGCTVMMDNTWGFHHFQPFQHGVDMSVQALTKYAVGHSDVLLGSITVATPAMWERLRTGSDELGQYASPDDCWLCLRGLRTLNVRIEAQARSALEVATWLRHRPEVKDVLYPALPGASGHDIWKRDFTGAASLFGVVFQPEIPVARTHAMIDRLALFGIGASWGGYESLALPTTGTLKRTAGTGALGGPSVRLHIGLEDPADLIADLAGAFEALHG